jgi:hypothetical protein
MVKVTMLPLPRLSDPMWTTPPVSSTPGGPPLKPKANVAEPPPREPKPEKPPAK